MLDIADEAASVTGGLRRLLARQPSQSAITSTVRDALGTTLTRQFTADELDEGDVISASLAVQRLIDGIESTDLMIQAVTDSEALGDLIMRTGGAGARNSLGNESAQTVFDLLLRTSLEFVAASAPYSQGFASATLPWILRRVHAVEQRSLAQDAALRVHESLIEQLASESTPAPVVALGTAGAVTVEPLVRGYLSEARALVPKQFADRDAEIADLAQFLTEGEEAWWWRADPWTGKTSLMASLTSNPPQGARVVSFFVLGRDETANSRPRFYAQVLPQLASLAGVTELAMAFDPAQVRAQFNDLLARAAQRCQSKGDRLLLLVDGLDEDAALADPASVRGSIAAAIPASLPEGVTVVVASRTNPQLPADVPTHHPLRSQKYWHSLAHLPTTLAAREAAMADLRDLLKTETGTNVAAFLAAGGAPLTSADLAELTDTGYLEVLRLLDSRVARSFTTVPSLRGAGDPPGYRLGHDKLDELLITLLNPRAPDPSGSVAGVWGAARFDTLKPWRQRIHDWARTWARLSWPDATPYYLLDDSYPALLELEQARISELVDLLADSHRNARLYQLDLSDSAALRQIRSSAAYLHQTQGSLADLGRLMATHERLATRNDRTKDALLDLLASTGQERRATYIASAVSDPAHRLHALLVVSETCVRANSGETAATAARLAAEQFKLLPTDSRWTLVDPLAHALVVAGLGDEAEALTEGLLQGEAVARAQRALHDESLDESWSLTRDPTWTGPFQEAPEVGRQLCHHLGRARAYIIEGHLASADAEARLALTEAQHTSGHVGLKLAIAGMVEAIALLQNPSRVTEATSRRQANLGLEPVKALAALGAEAQARTLASRLLAAAQDVTGGARPAALTAAGLCLAAAGEHAAASAAADAALEGLADNIKPGAALSDDHARLGAWEDVVTAVAMVAGADATVKVAQRLLGDGGQLAIIRGVVASGADAPVDLVERIHDPHARAAAVGVLASRASNPTVLEWLRRVTEGIPPIDARVEALAALVSAALGPVDEPALGTAMAQEVAFLADGCRNPRERRRALITTAGALAAIGDLTRACEVIRRMAFPADRVQALVEAAQMLGAKGDLVQALEFAHEAGTLTGTLGGDRTGDNEVLVGSALAGAGHPEYGLDLAEGVTNPRWRLRVVLAVVERLGLDRVSVASRATGIAVDAIAQIQSLENERGSLTALAASLSSFGYTPLAEEVLEKSLGAADELSASPARARAHAEIADVMVDSDPQRGIAVLGRSWIEAGCPWLGWSALAKVSPIAVVQLRDLLLAEFETP